MPSSSTIIHQARSEHDSIIAQHFYQLWLDNNVQKDIIHDDWLDITLTFIRDARQKLKFQAFIAQVEAEIVGSVSCQLFAGLYPSVFKAEHRNYGYIWNVYVQPDYRRQGIATQLTKAAIAYLQSLNCTKAVLNASLSGKPVYEQLGFVAGNEMTLNLLLE
ncbi:GNAT family N-acetyltransferase [Pleurocapsa sp. CCALA 161]|uniref:GNAT family N-acetyltransferase n=1 Tax=Pleurocapsa sp. CCALA 161 TaxID=2107688 RepID=UPI000D0542CF|nr:GNAT family N-acetyltransferase [Pleurocapsa sp. CCALA 161]PSB12230.1 GNAT family N-acetyltransferase [Pleurocapsa sp. CCALA 161]